MVKKYTGWAYISGSGAGAPVEAQYITLASDGTLDNERVLTPGANIGFTDAGAGGALTIVSSASAPTTAQYVTLATDGTLANERVLTAGSNITLTDGGAGSTLTIASPTGAPTTAQYVTLATDGTLANERVLTPGANIGFTDAGAGGALTIVSSASAAGVFTQFNATQGYTTSSIAVGINRAPLGRLHLETNNATTCIFFEREHSSISAGEELGCLAFGGTLNGGTNYAPNSAVVRAVADGGWSNISTDTPAKLQFMTTPDGSNTVYTRMTIKGDGKVGIGDLNPSGSLHVQSARAVVSPPAYADDLIVETAGTAGGISILNDDSNENWIAMGHTSDNLTSHWSDSYVTKIASFGSDNIYYKTAIASGNGAHALVLDTAQDTHVLGNLTVTGSLTRKDQARHLIYSSPATGNFTSTANAVNVFADGSWTTPPTWDSGSITANDIVFDQTTGRFTTSQPTRLYAVSCTVVAESNSTAAQAELTATVNGSTVFKLGQIKLYSTALTPMSLPMTFIVEMGASQYLEIFIDQVIGSHTVDVEYVNISIHAI